MSPTASGSGNGSSAPYFLSLTLQNIRCFGERAQALDLSKAGQPARWTVLLGNNGTGKTTVLQSLASFELIPRPAGSLYATWLPRYMHAQVERGATYLLRSDARAGKLVAEVAIADALEHPVRPGTTTTHTLDIERPGGTGWNNPAPPTEPPACFGYGASRRLTQSSLTTGWQNDAVATLFADDAGLTNAEEWLLRVDYSASKASDIRERQKARLDQVVQLLKDVLPEVDDIRFTEPTEERKTPAVEFKTPYGWVPLHGLGHGYRSLVAWMVDFASRMVDRYPDSPHPLREPAVVLVDEIDLHLHPTWQRKLVTHLSALFPTTQFVATAHSPLIVQGAGDANIAVLRREGDHVVIDNDVKAIRGWRVDQILTSDLFDVPTARPPQFDDKLRRRTTLLSQGALSPGDEEEVERLTAEIGALPTGETAEEARRLLKLAEETRDLLKKYGG